MRSLICLALALAACPHARPLPPPVVVADVPPPPPAPADPDLAALAAAFDLPPPDAVEADVPDLWSTHYHLWEAAEAAGGFVLLDPDDRPFPAGDPIALSGRDWCMTALEGSGRVTRADGSAVTVNYAGEGDVAVPCDEFIGRSWRSQGRVRFGFAGGPYGDGVRGWALVPYRTIAVDRDQQTIPYGRAVFVPAAVGDAFVHEGETFTHDGWFFAADTGGAIRDAHIDTFTGTATDASLDFVTSDPHADRFDARLVPADDPVAAILAGLHGA